MPIAPLSRALSSGSRPHPCPEIWGAPRRRCDPLRDSRRWRLFASCPPPLSTASISSERYLAQETARSRALNFNKGCYLGQEIVERIRSRATVHRTLRQFSLHRQLYPPSGIRQTFAPRANRLKEIPLAKLPARPITPCPACREPSRSAWFVSKHWNEKLPLHIREAEQFRSTSLLHLP